MKKGKDTLTYESAYAELQQIVVDLQGETTSIDALTEKIERARELIQFCRDRLRDTESAAEKLLE